MANVRILFISLYFLLLYFISTYICISKLAIANSPRKIFIMHLSFLNHCMCLILTITKSKVIQKEVMHTTASNKYIVFRI